MFRIEMYYGNDDRFWTSCTRSPDLVVPHVIHISDVELNGFVRNGTQIERTMTVRWGGLWYATNGDNGVRWCFSISVSTYSALKLRSPVVMSSTVSFLFHACVRILLHLMCTVCIVEYDSCITPYTLPASDHHSTR